MSLGVPVGLLVIRAFGRLGSLGFADLLADVRHEWLTYAYVAATSLAVTGSVGLVFGRWADRLHRLAVTDPLTGLFNRRHFAAQLNAAIASDRRFGLRTCVMCVDVDRLKAINDEFGHERGDEALVQVASVLSRKLRARDMVARFGGDEFAVLLPDTPADSAVEIGERILAEIRGSVPLFPAGLSVSIGIAELSSIATANDLMVAADSALYFVKGSGGGRVSMVR